MKARLYRSRRKQVIGGVCGGIAEYFDVDPTVVRVVAVLLALANPAGVLAYLTLWVIMPPQERTEAGAAETLMTGAGEIARGASRLRGHFRAPNRLTLAVGAGLVVLGALLLVQSLGLVWLRWLDADFLWPLLLIAMGFALMWRRRRE